MPALKNTKHEEFCKLVFKGMSQRQAYVAVGFAKPENPKTWTLKSGRLAKRSDIKERLRQLRDRAARRAVVTVAKTLEHMASIGYSDIRDVVEWGETIAVPTEKEGEYVTVNDMAIKASNTLDPKIAAAIKSVTRDPKTGQIKIEMYDKRAALHDIGQHLGMFVKRIGGPNGGPLQVQNSNLVTTITPEMSARDAAEAYQRFLAMPFTEIVKQTVVEEALSEDPDDTEPGGLEDEGRDADDVSTDDADD